MSGDTASDDANEAKANMDHIYDQPDPRAYFRELRKLSYAIPGVAKPIFQKLISRLRRQRNDTVHVLDLGCSYGVNAALLKHDLSMPDLYDHWGEDDIAALTDGSFPQRRLMDNAPRPISKDDLADLYRSALAYW